MIEPITKQFIVNCDVRSAFDLWTRSTTLWWPKSHKLTRDPDADVVFEPRAGGRIYERAADGREVSWGEILEWEPPHRLAYWWHIGAERREATHVEIRFSPVVGPATQVEIVHTGWERLADRGQNRRDRNLQGWAAVLPAYQKACRESTSMTTGHET